MKSKKSLFLILLLIIAVSLTACDGFDVNKALDNNDHNNNDEHDDDNNEENNS